MPIDLLAYAVLVGVVGLTGFMGQRSAFARLLDHLERKAELRLRARQGEQQHERRLLAENNPATHRDDDLGRF